MTFLHAYAPSHLPHRNKDMSNMPQPHVSHRSLFLAALFSTAAVLNCSGILIFGGSALAKGIPPSHVACDATDKSTERWTSCFGKNPDELTDAELFYTGYWLTRTGAYTEALAFLERVREPTAPSLTYTGFAIRKLGDAPRSLDYYGRALAMNPNYVVARSYRGEAYLALGEPAKAKAELAEIEARCGRACVEYTDLAAEIAKLG